jgi:serpin B
MLNLSPLKPLMVAILVIALFSSAALSKTDVVSSSNRFGLQLFKEIVAATDRDSNVCISPLSASYALTMTYNGAAGETRDAMASTLEFQNVPTADINDAYRKLTDFLITWDSSLTLEIANSIWYANGLPIKLSFRGIIQNAFGAQIRGLVPFMPGAADTINQWVATNTHEKIKTIIKPPMDPSWVMLLINAVYFKAMWQNPFDPSLTTVGAFNLPDGSQTDCQMMTKTDTFEFNDNELYRAASLPYGNGRFAMSLFLPQKKQNVDDLIKRLNDKNLSEWLSDFQKGQAKLILPRFRYSCDFGFNEALKSMGMQIAFDAGKADFSNIGDVQIWIDSVIHKTFIQVDEEGTEAAAVTAVILKKGLTPSIVFDRPFLFVIHERETGAVLFLGKVVNPIWTEE